VSWHWVLNLHASPTIEPPTLDARYIFMQLSVDRSVGTGPKC
jgi:hypothetical protein